MVNLASFWKPEACGQTVLPDRSVLIGQILLENTKIQMRHFEYFSNIVTWWGDARLFGRNIQVANDKKQFPHQHITF